MSEPRHQMTRVRRETKLRALTVTAIEALNPGMRRIHFASPQLHDFESASPDDHIKLFLPCPEEASGPMPGFCMRDYTPRRFDPDEGVLTIDFALHEAGPATAWALAAQVGDGLQIGGPRGSNIVADDFDWYWLVGDETALPAIGRRLEGLRAQVPVTTIVVIDTDADRQSVETPAAWTPIWVVRQGRSEDDATLLRQALDALQPPPGDGYIWIAAEGRVARTLRSYVLDDRGHAKAWVKAAGYWRRGEAAVHETFAE